MLERIGEVVELTLIKKDSLGKVTCFVIFKEPFILNRIENQSLPLSKWNSTLTFNQALSHEQLKQKKRMERTYRAQNHEVRRSQMMQAQRRKGDFHGQDSDFLGRETSQIKERELRQPYGLRHRRHYRGENRKSGGEEKRTSNNLDQFIRYNIKVHSENDIARKKIFVGKSPMSLPDFLSHYEKGENSRFLGIEYQQNPKGGSNNYETKRLREIDNGQASLIRDIDFESAQNQSVRRQSYQQPYDMKEDQSSGRDRGMFGHRGRRGMENHLGHSSSKLGNEFGEKSRGSLFKRSRHPQGSW